MTEDLKRDSNAPLQVIGECRDRLFGLLPGERLRRQMPPEMPGVLVADASALLCNASVAYLIDHAEHVLVSPAGRRLAVLVPDECRSEAEVAIAGGSSRFTEVDARSVAPHFVRKLRKRDELLARSSAEEPVLDLERLLFANSYKGVTDLITKWVWPFPAFWVVRALSRMGVSPNVVTTVGLVLTFVAAILFYQGQLALGLVAAWTMTFLDTVDGKLARVTLMSSRLGDFLDHATDYIHPPFWWLCMAAGIVHSTPSESGALWTAAWVIVITYTIGRTIEVLFKWRIGFNQYLWRRFDSQFRLIISRRNIILLIMTIGLAAGVPNHAFLACAAWNVCSTIIQAVRLTQALHSTRRGSLSSWLM